ncbi:unnamed protein product [Cyprideis torosa]|uniref:Uncharacterized protein n=1 Tax=Cyprideis torosa TaxID=163714 RepID=A0A7R8WEQ1_9CRUS|nr:unnamed protein product [Cyprideis torosa]CAG0896091.1 unnamed protein product [Cyprideis torosa]
MRTTIMDEGDILHTAKRLSSFGLGRPSFSTESPLSPLNEAERRMSEVRRLSEARKLSEAGIPRRESKANQVLTPDTDQFMVGQTVWVGGTKPGRIAFIGEVKFAPGMWAGVVLDDPVGEYRFKEDVPGKNDGSVGGVHYFMCAPKYGVFSRLERLTYEPLAEVAGHYVPTNGSPVRGNTPDRRFSSERRYSSERRSSSRDSPRRSLARGSSPAIMDGKGHNLLVGDRVMVTTQIAGTRYGYLRYLGPTDFAKGEYAGVELDEPVGKNDGAVHGKRYFVCRPLYGIFAPINKVTRSTVAPRQSLGKLFSSHRRTSNTFMATHRNSISPEHDYYY